MGKTIKSNTLEFINKSNIIHNYKYNYSLVVYKNNRDKVIIICNDHGEFTQSPRVHLSKCGCPKCGGKKKLTNIDFIERSNIVHNNKFDYSLVKYVSNRKKVDIICQKHGIFSQIPFTHLSGSNCPKCSSTSLTDLGKFIKISNEVHENKYDYSLVDGYKNNKSKIKVICMIHGIFEPTINNHIRGTGCPDCSLSNSKGEKEVIKYLEKYKVSYIRQYRFDKCRNINRLPFDFYLPDYKTCIEYNGIQHYMPIGHFGGLNSFKYRLKNDKIKSEFCIYNNINLISISYLNIKYIESIILNKIKILTQS